MTPTKRQWIADKKLAKEMGKMAAATQNLAELIEKSTKPIWQSKIIWAAAIMLGIQIYLAVSQGVTKNEIVGGVFAALVAVLRLITTKTLTKGRKGVK